MHLTVRVNKELVLDAGNCAEVRSAEGRELVIRPPRKTLFQQIITYLRAKPNPPTPLSGSFVGREGVAAAAVTLRWGSYLAVLLDHEKAIWSETRSPITSRISDREMARINIEASAAMVEWVDLCRAYWAGQSDQYKQLVNRAVAYLPMPKKTSKREMCPFVALALADFAARCINGIQPEWLERARSDCKRFPSRVFANALINSAWRNGPVEDIHAGNYRGYPMEVRRVTPAEERHLMAETSEKLAAGMDVCLTFDAESPRRRWSEQVLPYALAQMFLITPSAWTLTERSREVRLRIS